MKYFGLLGIFLLGMICSVAVRAQDIEINAAFARASLPGQADGMVNLTITSKRPAVLVGVSSTVCKAVELHAMTHENGMMKMREVAKIELPADKTVNLGESGYHLMLIALNSPLKEGESVPLALKVKVGKRVSKIKVSAIVKSALEAQSPREHDTHSHLN